MALPAPEVDITKTVFFAGFKTSGGPFYGTLLFNQYVEIKQLQEIRRDLSRHISLWAKTKPQVFTFKDEVQAILDDEVLKETICKIAINFVKKEHTNLIVTKNAGTLPDVAEKLFAAIKKDFVSWEDPELIIDDTERLRLH